jgi:recombination protein RecT
MTQTETAVAKKPEGLKGLLQDPSIRSRFEQVLGGRAPAFMSSILSAASANKSLSEADPMSVISSAAVAASMDLPINASLGFAHIVAYQGKNDPKPVAQFQMGWKGFVQLAQRTGQYKTINLALVYEGQLKCRNSFTGEMEFQEERTSDKVIGYLLYFKLIGGFEKYFYMTREQIHEHAKEYSKAFKKGYGPWVDDFDSMGLKTVCKLGLSKFGPLSVELQKAFTLDQAVIDEQGEPRYVDAEPRETTLPPESRTEKMNKEASAKTNAAPSIPPKDAPAPASASPVIEVEQGEFKSFAEPTSLFGKTAKDTTAEETIEQVQEQIILLKEQLGVSDSKWTMHMHDMFGPKVDRSRLSLKELQRFRDDYQKKLAAERSR